MNITLILLIVLLVVAFAAHLHSRDDAKLRDERDMLKAHVPTLSRELIAAQSERDAAIQMRDHWKESSSEWRKEALTQRAGIRELYDQLQEALRLQQQRIPDLTEAIADPPTVAEADRKATEERRARTAVPVRDARSAPVPRAERSLDEEDDGDD